MKVRLMALFVSSLIALATSACAPAVVSVAPSTAGASATSAAGITREQAIAVARAAAPMWVRGDVISAAIGTFADLSNPNTPLRTASAPAAGHAVWRVEIGFVNGPLDASGADVIVDAIDGTVIQFWEWVS